jgi:probable HAF family extracellular repeat protein
MRLTFLPRSSAWLAALVSAWSLARLIEGQTWEAVPLGTLGGDGALAYGVNDFGEVVGSSTTSEGGFHAFVWRNGVMTELGTPEGYSSIAYGINNAGVAVGYLDGSVERAVRWVPGGSGGYQMFDLGDLGGSGSFARAMRINNAGQITGYASAPTEAEHAFLWTGGTMIDLGTLQFSGSTALSHGLGLNESGRVVGYATAQGQRERAFFYDGTQQLDIAPQGDVTVSVAYGLNDADLIAGYVVSSQTAFQGRAAVFAPATQVWSLIDLLPNTNRGRAFDINDSGHVVGISFQSGFPFSSLAFIKTDSGVLDLNQVSTGSPAVIFDAEDISNTGYIAANAEPSIALLLIPAGICTGDLDDDNTVGTADLAILLSHFGVVGNASPSDGDLDLDRDVDLSDLTRLLTAFGTTCD